MHYGIIAAGHGSRLAQEGLRLPKPMAPVAGLPMIGRLVRMLEHANAESISVVLNPDFEDAADYLRCLECSVPVNVRLQATPSSLHTCAALSDMLAPDERCIICTVDTVLHPQNFEKYAQAWAQAGEETDALMAVTATIDDEKPLWVEVGRGNAVAAFSDAAPGEAQWVSAGIYGLGPRARQLLSQCVAAGISRMRNYQRELLVRGLRVEAWDIGCAIDVDHVEDLAKAEQLLTGNYISHAIP